MREIIFDTETTGLDPSQDRIIEFGGIELVNRFPTGRTFHVYLNPQGRAINVEAQAVHGISEADLVGKPTFADVSDELFAFIDGAHLVAHNAGFDTAFLNAEFTRLGLQQLDPGFVVDTLAIAKRKHPMGPNSLDALCRRYGVDNSHRTKHGALLDSELLAEVYIELIGGKQAALLLEVETEITVAATEGEIVIRRQRERPLAPRLSAAEREAHRAMVEELGADALWRRVDPGYRATPVLSESA